MRTLAIAATLATLVTPATAGGGSSPHPYQGLSPRQYVAASGLEELLSIAHRCVFAIDADRLESYMQAADINTPAMKQYLSDAIDLANRHRRTEPTDRECTLSLFAAVGLGIIGVYPDGTLITDLPLDAPPFQFKDR